MQHAYKKAQGLGTRSLQLIKLEQGLKTSPRKVVENRIEADECNQQLLRHGMTDLCVLLAFYVWDR